MIANEMYDSVLLWPDIAEKGASITGLMLKPYLRYKIRFYAIHVIGKMERSDHDNQ